MATKFWIAAAFLIVALSAAADSFWDGGAAAQRGDATFESGYYVASNSFPVNTEVIVQNLETGKTVTAIVIGRIDGQGDLLVLLSPKVAAAIGISQGQVAPVRVTIKSSAYAQSRARAGDLPYSQDPDVNPTAGLGMGSTAAPAENPGEKSVAVVESASPVPAEKPPAAEEPVKTIPVTPAAEKTAVPAQPEQKTAEKPDNSVLEKMAARTPQKQHFFPPREDQKFAYQPPIEPPVETKVVEQPKEPEPKVGTASVDKASVTSLPPYAPALAEALDVEMALARPPSEMIPSIEGSLAPIEGPPYKEALALESMPEPAQPGVELIAEAPPPTMELSSPVPVPPYKEELALGTPHEPGQPAEAAPPTRELSASVPTPPYKAGVALGPIHEPEQPAEELLAEAPPLTQELSSPVPIPPEAAAEETVIALEPTAPQPPAEKTAEEPKIQKPPVAVALVPVEKPRETKPATAPAMTKADYYLQLGAYANERQAKDVASGLPSSYPVSVIGPESPARPIFRIVLGPLNKAESGTLLYWFRDRGFPDAFIRTVR